MQDTRRLAIGLTLGLMAAGCGGSGGGATPASTPSATLSEVDVAPSSVPADAISPAVVTVRVRDGAGQPMAGQAVSIAFSGSGAVSPATAATNASGTATFQVTAAAASAGTITATVGAGADRVVLAATPTLAFFLPGCEARAATWDVVLKCEWTGPEAGDPWPAHVHVLSAPIVVDLDLDGDPATLAPSIAFVAHAGSDPGVGACIGDATSYGVLRVIDGATCAPQFSVGSVPLVPATSLAAGDVDLAPDARPEIVGIALGGRPVAFRYDPVADAMVLLWGSTRTTTDCLWTGPALADVEGDGLPEVLVGGDLYTGDAGAERAPAPFTALTPGRFGVVADLPAGRRLVAGGATWEWAGTAWTLDASGFADGFVAVADLGTFGADPLLDSRASRDGAAEIVTVAAGAVEVKTPGGRTVLGPIAPPELGAGGPPAVADFDGDGRAEIAVSGRTGLVLVDPDCPGAADPACPGSAATPIAWTQAIQDLSSGRSGTVAFDFDNDGAAEVVHADECYLRVLDGRSGDVLVRVGRRSLTWLDMPVIADVDADGRAEVVVSSSGVGALTCPADSPSKTGIQVLGEPSWARARPLWNQHSYTNGSVAAGGGIPANPIPDFALGGPNGFRLQDACAP